MANVCGLLTVAIRAVKFGRNVAFVCARTCSKKGNGMAKKRNKKGSTKKLIIVGALVFAVWYFYNQTMKVSIGGAAMRVHKVGLSSVELRIDLTIINESNLALDVQNFLGQVFYQATSLGIVTQVRAVTLQPFETGTVEFKAVISYVSVGMEFFNELKALLNKQPTKINLADFTVRGTLKAENLSIPINEKLLA